MFKKIARFIARHLVLTAFVVLVLVAVLVTAGRLLVPLVLADFADETAAWASSVIGQNVIIGRLDSRWKGLGPEVVARDVVLMSEDGSRPVLRLDAVTVDFGLGDMIRTGFLAPGRVSVSGAHLVIVRHPDGRLTVQGVEAGGRWDDGASDGGPARGDASALLLIPPRVSLTNARIEWIDRMKGRPPVVLDHGRLLIRNDATRHQADLDFDIEGRPISVRADIKALGGRLQDWHGDVYLKLARMLLPDLPNQAMPGGYTLAEGTATLELWSRWQSGRPQWVQGRIDARDLRIESASGAGIDAEALEAAALWRFDGSQWSLHLDHAELEQAGIRSRIGPLSLSVSHAKSTAMQYRLLADELDLAEISPLLTLVMPEEKARELALAVPKGKVRNLRLALRPLSGPAYSIRADLTAVSFNAVGPLPAVENFSATVNATNNGGRIRLGTQHARIHPAQLFRWPIPLDELEGELHWQRLARGWRLETGLLQARNEHIATRTRMRLDLPQAGSPVIDLQTDFRDGVATQVPVYLPTVIMNPRLVEWLDNALVDGRVPSGTAVLRGPLSDVPFHLTHNGHFEVLFGVEDAYLDYQTGWPPLERLSAELRFHNNRLDIVHGEAELFGTWVKDLEAHVDSLNPVSPLEISGTTVGPLEDGLRFLRETPMSERFSLLTTKDTTSAGDARTLIALSLSLRSEGTTRFSGTIETDDGALNLAPIGIEVAAIKGTLDFDETGISAKGIKGVIDGVPVRVDISTQKGTTRIRGTGRFSTDQLKRRYPVVSSVPIDGRSAWEIAVSLPPSASGAPVHIDVSSGLEGTRVDLPLGLGKTAEQTSPFSAGFNVDNRFPEGLTIGYDALNAKVGKEGRHWVISLEGDPANGKVRIPPAGSKEPIQADMNRLSIDLDIDTGPGKPPTDRRDPAAPAPSDFPEIDLTAGTLLLNGNAYGALEVRTRRIGSGIRLDRMSLTSDDGDLRVTGDWTGKGDNENTTLEAHIETRDFGRTLRDLRMSESLHGSAGELAARLQWQGGPATFEPRTIAGEIKLRAEDGSFEDTDVGVGRILALTNVTALQRRLRLDFSDLIDEGFPFDKLEGDFTIENGVARTENAAIKGPMGTILIRGETDLAARRFDQQIVVTPALSGAAAIAGVLAGGPAVGAAMLVAGKGLEQLANVTYRMTGPWDAPKIERIGSSERNEEGDEKDKDAPKSNLPVIH